MTKHTPAPWNPYFNETYGVLGPDKGRVAICMNLKGAHGLAGRRHGDEVAANARLIAAAPELLEALREMVEVHDEPCRLDHHGYCQSHFLDEVNDGGCRVANAISAIKKATGG